MIERILGYIVLTSMVAFVVGLMLIPALFAAMMLKVILQ